MTLSLVVVLSPVRCNGVRYAPGERVLLSDSTAQELIAAGAVAFECNPSPLAAALAKLDLDNPQHWTRTGKPRVDVLSSWLGRPVSVAERDAAWQGRLSPEHTALEQSELSP